MVLTSIQFPANKTQSIHGKNLFLIYFSRFYLSFLMRIIEEKQNKYVNFTFSFDKQLMGCGNTKTAPTRLTYSDEHSQIIEDVQCTWVDIKKIPNLGPKTIAR